MHLAQLNVARLRNPIDDPLIDDFRTNLAPINALAETVEDAIARLEHLRAHGPSARAFTFRHRFGPGDTQPQLGSERDPCPA